MNRPSTGGGGFRPSSKTSALVRRVDGDQARLDTDTLATEEPLEVRLAAGGHKASVAITMRTPGSDFELAVGFLHSEGILRGRADVRAVRYCTASELDGPQRYNIVTVELAGSSLPDLARLERHFTASSACGVCGRASLESLALAGTPPVGAGPVLDAGTLCALPERLRAAQGLFAATGGLHAAGLFDAAGELLCLREDVGRHNAVDKVIGWALLAGRLPLSAHILVVSGRSSYEVLQKALVAGIPFVAGVSAPSSLAVDVARRFGMTLVGFLRGERFNVYAGEERLPGLAVPPETKGGRVAHG